MALQGTLDSFSLPDVLRLLADTGKTGRLHVEGDRGEASVWIDDGSVVAADAEGAVENAATDEVLFEMLRFGSGSFVFAAGEQSANGGQPVDLEGVLQQAGELLEEWRELEAVVPSMQHHVAIAPELTVDQVTIDASRWTTLVAVAGGLSVAELGKALGQSELAIMRTVSDLVELGIVVVQEPSKGPASRRSSSGRRPRAEVGERSPVARSRSVRVPVQANEEAGKQAVGVNGRSNGEDDASAARREKHGRVERDRRPAARERVLSDRASGERSSAGADGAQSSTAASLRRSRNTGQRTSRQVGGHAAAAHGASVPALPSASPFSGGTVMPPQQGLPGGVGAGQVGQPAAIQPAQHGQPGQHFGQQGLSALPPFDNNESQGMLPPSLDTGPLGPSPLAPPSSLRETGQVPVVAASSLPPDLSWAAEDEEAPLGRRSPGPSSPPMGNPPVPMGRSGAPLLSPGRMPGPDGPAGGPPLVDGDTALHVAVMSPEARMAVEATVGPAGGGSGVVPAAGATPEEIHQRGALLGFLSSVRH